MNRKQAGMFDGAVRGAGIGGSVGALMGFSGSRVERRSKTAEIVNVDGTEFDLDKRGDWELYQDLKAGKVRPATRSEAALSGAAIGGVLGVPMAASLAGLAAHLSPPGKKLRNAARVGLAGVAAGSAAMAGIMGLNPEGVYKKVDTP